MRKTIVVLALLALLSGPVAAQIPGIGRGGQGGDMLLLNKGVQEELKLDDKQKDSIKKVQDDSLAEREKIKEAIMDKDFEKVKEIFEKINKDTSKGLAKVREGLNKDQARRFQEIEIQQATKQSNPDIFTRAAIQKDLKLDDDQKKTVKTATANMEKDIKELTDEAGGDITKMFGMGKKIAEIRRDAFAKITKSLNDDQKKTWKDMAGKEFDLKFDNPFKKKKDE